jgi:hypothetical protein
MARKDQLFAHILMLFLATAGGYLQNGCGTPPA